MDIIVPQTLAAQPAWLAIMVTVGVPAAFALLLGRLMYSMFTPAEFQANVRVGAVKYSFIVEIYAAVAALSLVGAWDTFESARQTVRQESSALYMLALASDTFSTPGVAETRAEMRGAIRDYATAVVAHDWPAMQAGVTSSASDAAFQRLARAFMNAHTETQAQQALQQTTGEWVSRVADARIARLSVGSRTIAGLIWTLVLTVSVAVLVFQWFYGGASATMHFTMAAVIAIIVGVVLLVAIKMAFPYVGEPPMVAPTPYLSLMDLR